MELSKCLNSIQTFDLFPSHKYTQFLKSLWQHTALQNNKIFLLIDIINHNIHTNINNIRNCMRKNLRFAMSV